MIKSISKDSLQWLDIAIMEAEQWRGSLTGHPDGDEVLDDFDRRIRKMREVLNKVIEQQKQIRKMNREGRNASSTGKADRV